MSRRSKEPVTVALDRLESKGTSGLDARARRWTVRGAPVGAVVRVLPQGKGRARRLEIVEPAADQTEPRCPVFGVCGGCTLQEMPLSTQRVHKTALVSRSVGFPSHEAVGGPNGYGTRNKLELGFGARRFTTEPGPPETGAWLGFHPPGWYSKVVPVDGCPLASDAMNRVIARVAAAVPGPAWDTLKHTGHWRNLVVREGDDGVLVGLVTTSSASEEQVRALADSLAAVAGVVSVLWMVNDGVAEVAQGELRSVLSGRDTLLLSLGGVEFELPHDGFFQVNREGAEVLLETIARALPTGGTLLDLYCGTGALGIALASRFDRVVGIELHEPSVACARRNAERNGVEGTWVAGPVEDLLPTLPAFEGPRSVLVDPPRSGLHKNAVATLAGVEADTLVYVACNPASLGRDREGLEAGGWRMTDLWTVDLFPQTNHVEAVARFIRGSPT